MQSRLLSVFPALEPRSVRRGTPPDSRQNAPDDLGFTCELPETPPSVREGMHNTQAPPSLGEQVQRIARVIAVRVRTGGRGPCLRTGQQARGIRAPVLHFADQAAGGVAESHLIRADGMFTRIGHEFRSGQNTVIDGRLRDLPFGQRATEDRAGLGHEGARGTATVPLVEDVEPVDGSGSH